MNHRTIAWCLIIHGLGLAHASAQTVYHYVFFGQDREQIKEASRFLETETLEGAQIRYSWRQLEPEKDEYDFSIIRDDLAFLASKGKRLFVQFQDVTFSQSRINVPQYLLDDPEYHGGAARQYSYQDEEADAVVEGWVARRWDPAVQERLYQLFFALGEAFDGQIAGINLAETSVEFGESGRLFPEGFSFEIYRDAVIANMTALKRAFPNTVVIQYANFMPGEWLPADDHGYLRAVYRAAEERGIGVGGPDLLPYRPGQLAHSYPLIQKAADVVPAGIAVQEGNYEHRNPESGMPVTIAELIRFAAEHLKVDYIFWCTQEPFYSRQVLPFFEEMGLDKGH